MNKFLYLIPKALRLFLCLSVFTTSAFAVAPTIDSPLAETAEVGVLFSYQITATGLPIPTNYAATSLPPGLSHDGNGNISGTPVEDTAVSGPIQITIAVSNADGIDMQVLELTIVDLVPSINSPATENGNVGSPFSYTITAENFPDTFDIIGLEVFDGLVFDDDTGTIQGTPIAGKTGDVIIQATNSAGTGFAILTIDIASPQIDVPPVIISPLSATAVVGQSFVYQIETQLNTPVNQITYAATSLPPGLSHLGDGTIIGAPVEDTAVSGPIQITIAASNADGIDTQVLELTIVDLVPSINSPATANGIAGSSFSYTITADNVPDTFSVTGLDAFGGLAFDPLTGEISGTPTSQLVAEVIIEATNSAGTDSEVLEIRIEAPLLQAPVITSALVVTGSQDQTFEPYTITADNSPTSLALNGALPSGLIFSTATATISGIPTEIGDFPVQIEASNATGTTTETLLIQIVAGPATVVILTPDASSGVLTLENGSTISVTATVTPAIGETLATVFVRWNNPPAKPDGSPRIPLFLASLNGDPMGGEYTGTINIGFDPENGELGGGDIDLEVVAFQESVTDSDTGVFGSDSVNIVIEPLLDVLFPDDKLDRSSFALGDIFASVRVGSNDLAQVSARISGPGIIDLVTETTSNPNGVYNFNTTKAITSAGAYFLRVEALDAFGSSTVIERELSITETPSDPIARVISPNPGFTNEVFSPATVSFNRESSQNVTNDVGDIIGYDITYRLSLISSGQGYYPRNNADVVIPGANSQGLVRGISGIAVSNGRIVSVPETVVGYTAVGDPSFGNSGNLIMDNPSNSGASARIQIAAQFFKANASLVSYKLFVNGEDVTPGNGNLVSDGVTPIDVPSIDFPPDGSPEIGDYVVTAQVYDADGNVGVSSPISFQILPYEPLEISLSRQGVTADAPGDPITIGGSATFLADVAPLDEIESVKFFESLSGDELGDGSRVQIGGQEIYRCAIVFPEAGDFKVFAVGTAFNGQTVDSAPVDIKVESGEFPVVAITSPSPEEDVPSGLNLGVLVTAYSPDIDGQITKVEVFNGSELLGVATPTGVEVETPTGGFAGQYRLDLTPTAEDAGVLNLVARATDDRGNFTDSDVVPIGVVLGAVPQIEILSPSAGTEFFVGQPFEIRARITDASPGGSITAATLTDINFFTSVQGVNGTITVIRDSLSFFEDTMSQSSTPDEYVFIATINFPDVVDLVIDATDNAGNTSQSPPLQFTITNGIVPDVAITTSLAGATYNPGDTVTIDIASSDADGSVTQVEVFNGNTSLGLAGFVSNGNYRFDYVANGVGIVNLSARSTDNIGNVGVSNVETISVAYAPFSVNFISPTGSTYVIEGGADESFSATRLFAVEIDGVDASNLVSLDWQLDDGSTARSQSLVEGSLTYSQSFEFSDTSILKVTATNSAGISVETSLTVFVNLPDPGAGDLTDFINFIYSQVQGLFPSADEVQAAIEMINALGGDTPASRAAFAATLFPSDQYDISQYQTVALVYKTLTGRWPTRTQLFTGIDTILQDTRILEFQTRVPDKGSITTGTTQTFSFNYSEGDEVVISVTGDGANANPLLDPTLSVSRPDGSVMPFVDDNGFDSATGVYSRDPELRFTASQTGSYTATVGGYRNLDSGDFAIESVSTTTELNFETLAAIALVESLKGSYNGANGFLANGSTDPDFLAQIYLNKHGVGITPLNSALLNKRLGGVDKVKTDGTTLPGYQGNVVNFVADFALDVDLNASNRYDPNGSPYSKIIYYGRPNDPLPSWYQARAAIEYDANLNSALSAFLDIQNPTATDLASYADITLELTLEKIFGSDQFDEQFVGDTRVVDTDSDGITNYYELLLGTDPSDGSVEPAPADSFVARIMVNLGVVDSDKVAAVVDADGDGASNIAEILLNTDPSNIDDKLTTSELPSEFEFPYFFFEFVRLKSDLITPDMPSVVVECAGVDMAFMEVSNLESKLSSATDQSGIGSDYERFEFRVDVNDTDCGFFRLKVK